MQMDDPFMKSNGAFEQLEQLKPNTALNQSYSYGMFEQQNWTQHWCITLIWLHVFWYCWHVFRRYSVWDCPSWATNRDAWRCLLTEPNRLSKCIWNSHLRLSVAKNGELRWETQRLTKRSFNTSIRVISEDNSMQMKVRIQKIVRHHLWHMLPSGKLETPPISRRIRSNDQFLRWCRKNKDSLGAAKDQRHKKHIQGSWKNSSSCKGICQNMKKF